MHVFTLLARKNKARPTAVASAALGSRADARGERKLSDAPRATRTKAFYDPPRADAMGILFSCCRKSKASSNDYKKLESKSVRPISRRVAALAMTMRSGTNFPKW